MSQLPEKQRKRLFAFLKSTGPEIISDAPSRIEPGKPLPVVCFIRANRAGRITVDSISVKITQDRRSIYTTTALKNPATIDTYAWQRIFVIDLPEKLSGYFNVDVVFNLAWNGKKKVISNCSVQRFKNHPLKVFRASEPLPRPEGLYYGDINFHNYFASQMVEFFLPVPASVKVAESAGLDFYVAAMRSDNFDESERDQQRLWKRFVAEINNQNQSGGSIILHAEEIACKNSRGKTVKLLSINNDQYVQGVDNPSQQKSSTDSQLLNILRKTGQNSLNFAIPENKLVSRFKKLFTRSGRWRKSDLNSPNLSGIQIQGLSNGTGSGTLKNWIDVLVSGKKTILTAGSRAEGLLSQRQQKSIPFIGSGNENSSIFGKVKTGVFCSHNAGQEEILNSLKKGRAIITDGPVLNMVLTNEHGESATFGGELQGKEFSLKLHGLSSSEFGSITKIELYYGDTQTKSEELIMTYKYKSKTIGVNHEIGIESRSKFCYIRGSLTTRKKSGRGQCLTNPIWFRENNA